LPAKNRFSRKPRKEPDGAARVTPAKPAHAKPGYRRHSPSSWLNLRKRPRPTQATDLAQRQQGSRQFSVLVQPGEFPHFGVSCAVHGLGLLLAGLPIVEVDVAICLAKSREAKVNSAFTMKPYVLLALGAVLALSGCTSYRGPVWVMKVDSAPPGARGFEGNQP